MKNGRENFSEARETEIGARGTEAKNEKEIGTRGTEAQNEAEIGARELAQEILPLLKEHFVAKCRLTEDGVSMRFPNGQHATVAVWFSKE